MSAPRVPAGWTREAADLVHFDWLSCRDGRCSVIPSSAETPYRIAERFSDATPESVPLLSEAAAEAALAALGDAGLVEFTGVHAWWTSPEARLRAWAAVGAPVLAPAEDGKASLAEWVAAAEGSALGMPMPGTADYGAAWALFFASATVTFLAHGAWVQHNGGEVVCATPAELRACLDRLAAEARS